MFANLSRRHPTLRLAAGCCVCAALGVVLFWGFTVDDALVTARVAWRLANGQGYRFNASGRVVDAVTPLGWAYVLVPFAKGSPTAALAAARWLGAILWITAAGWLGHALARRQKRPNLAVLLLAATPLGAWSSAGMETGAVLALCVFALGDSLGSLVALSLAAALRPELVPFCTMLGIRLYTIRRRSTRWALVGAFLPLGGVALTAWVRALAFGSAVPLAAVAKPSDLVHGLWYASGAVLWTGPAWLWLGSGWTRLEKDSRWFAAAIAVHFASLILVGGDWMPLWRLAVPVMPAMFWVAHDFVSLRSGLARNWGAVIGAAMAAVLGWRVGIPGRNVVQARGELIEDARSLLKGARLVAGLDIGWLGTATTSDVMDLAGITDTQVASLPGGHTTKRIPNSWFDFRRPDTLVLLSADGASLAADWWETRFARGVENHVAQLDYWRKCCLRGSLPLKYTRQFYVVVGCAE